MPIITLRRVTDLAALEYSWRDLELRSDPSFFQSWTWIGCLVEDRFNRPVLLEATEKGRIVALALFNHRPRLLSAGVLWLGESGRSVLDTLFVEHNGPLIASGFAGIMGDCLAAASTAAVAPRRASRPRALRLNGVGDTVLAAARDVLGSVRVQTREAPYLDLAELGDRDYVASLGRSTRQQLRRSLRDYRVHGQVELVRAQSVAEALAFLGGLIVLHQASWKARGMPGAFANPFFVRFHRQLIQRGVPRGEVEVWRLNAGDEIVGYLYNFRLAGRVYAYQSGFSYHHSNPRAKPGLTAHHLAIEQCQRRGDVVYDFLAGSARYKTSLCFSRSLLHWIR